MARGICRVVRRDRRRFRETGSGEGREAAEALTFLLDTDTCIYALKHNEAVLRHLLSSPRESVFVSVITEGELRTGAAKSASPVKTLHLVENFLRPLTIIEFTSDDAIVYAGVRARLERYGTPIGPLDTLIASQAVGRSLTLVSNNERECRRVNGLDVANWLR